MKTDILLLLRKDNLIEIKKGQPKFLRSNLNLINWLSFFYNLNKHTSTNLMGNILEYRSKTFGLWARFITKLIATFFFTFLMSLYLFKFFQIPISTEEFLWLTLIPLTIAIWIVFKENPMLWRNIVQIDFDDNKIKIRLTDTEFKEMKISFINSIFG